MSSFKISLKRGLKTFWNTRSLFSTGIAFSWNYHAYKTIATPIHPWRSAT